VTVNADQAFSQAGMAVSEVHLEHLRGRPLHHLAAQALGHGADRFLRREPGGRLAHPRLLAVPR